MRTFDVCRALATSRRRYPQFEISLAVVCAVAIFVMGTLSGFQRASEYPFEDNPVFGLVAFWGQNLNVARPVKVSGSMPTSNRLFSGSFAPVFSTERKLVGRSLSGSTKQARFVAFFKFTQSHTNIVSQKAYSNG